MPEDDGILLPPSLVAVPGATPALIGGVFAAAAGLYRAAPWTLLGEQTPLEVCCPAGSTRRLVVVLGAGGQAYGLCAYDSAADLQQALESADPLAAAGALRWLALSYEPSHFIARQDLEAVKQHGWQAAEAQAYPAITRLGMPGPDLHAPFLEDLVWLEGALPALAEFCQGYPAQEAPSRREQGAWTSVVKTHRGPAEVSVRILASGNITR